MKTITQELAIRLRFVAPGSRRFGQPGSRCTAIAEHDVIQDDGANGVIVMRNVYERCKRKVAGTPVGCYGLCWQHRREAALFLRNSFAHASVEA